ncbi:UPF0481 protein-like [Iris pallida]|uniref:UPF0481 protein-like n=1 Tax=Iris pallida TaxID=29817 RepID=A0AAX6DQR5_IRIPA|nr:UPF0481 protein-like [Iris pallida]
MASEGEEHVPLARVRVEDSLLKDMKGMLQVLDSTPEKEEPCTIYRVLPSVRDEHAKDYEPKIVSIGPFHHKNDPDQPMEKLKWRYLQDLLGRTRDSNMLQKYVDKVRELEPRAREHYAEPVEPDSDAFVKMMVVDGSFVVEFLIKMYYVEKERRKLDAVNWNLPLLRNDLLLLENQIPFLVLVSLFEVSDFGDLLPDLGEDDDDDVPVTLMKLAISYITKDKFECLPSAPDPSLVHHLLHLYHLSLLPTPPEPVARSCCHTMVHMVKKVKALALGSFLWLLSSLLHCRIPLDCCEGERALDDEESVTAPRVIPSVTELKESGVEFKKKTNAGSLLDVVFRDGVLEIPVLAIQERTPPLFRNLIAFEQCCPASGSHFTCYAAFLNNLVDTPGDVAILKERGVIESKLGQDEEVADLFHKLGKGAYLDFEDHYLVELFKEVRRYHEFEHHRWRAKLMHDYFGNPWAIISLVAAVILLVVTVLQTFYTMYAYYHPPSQS